MSHTARIPMTLVIKYKEEGASRGTKHFTLDEIANIINLYVESMDKDDLDILHYHWEANYSVDEGSVRPPQGVKA